MKVKKEKRRLGKAIIIVFFSILLYIVIGMLLPFWNLKSVHPTKKQDFQVSDFYGTGEFVDRAQIVEDSIDALKMRIRMLDQAKERIIFTTFDMRQGESTKDIIAVLMKAADRGVDIKIIVDGVSGLIRMQNKDLFEALASYPGIEVKLYNKPNPFLPWTLHGRMHDKYIIIDDAMVLMGGRNSFDYFLGDYTEKNKSEDREVFLLNTEADLQNPHLDDIQTESSVYQMEEYFKKVWDLKICTSFPVNEKTVQKDGVKKVTEELDNRYQELQKKWPELFQKDFDYIAYTIPIKKATLIYNPDTIYGKEPWVWYQLKELMLTAKEKVYIHTPYAVFSKEMYEGIAQIQNQAEVTMQINSITNGDNFCASSDYLYHKDEILETGITLYEYEGGNSSHGKSLLIDDTISVVGSYNFDMRSTYVDTELMFVIHGEEFNQLLEEKLFDLQKDCRKVIDKKNYEENPDIVIANLPAKKKVLMYLAGLAMQLARCLI